MGGLTFESIEHILSRSTQNIVYPVDLVQFVLAWKQGLLGDQFEQDAAETPNVHLLIIIAICHETLRCSVPSRGDVVRVGKGRVLPLARPQIGQFDEVALDEYVFGLDIPVEDALFVHELDGPEYLEHVELDLLEGEGVFLIFEALVHVHVHEFEDEGELAYLGGWVPLGSS